MIKPQQRKFQTYTDGWGTSWKVSDRRLTEVRQQTIHYDEFSVGMYRYWEAYVAGVQIKKAILVPLETQISEGDIFVDSSGEQYEVKQVDRRDTRPVSLLVSLASATIGHRSRNNGGN